MDGRTLNTTTTTIAAGRGKTAPTDGAKVFGSDEWMERMKRDAAS
jgi:hypothetical protein